MPNMNKIEIIGHLSNEPELKYTPNGESVFCKFTVPTNYNYTNSDGESIKRTEWFEVVTWNKQAENCNQYLSKGKLVYVHGRLHLNQFKTRDGENASRLEITANTVLFLSPKSDNGETESESEDGDY